MDDPWGKRAACQHRSLNSGAQYGKLGKGFGKTKNHILVTRWERDLTQTDRGGDQVGLTKGKIPKILLFPRPLTAGSNSANPTGTPQREKGHSSTKSDEVRGDSIA